MLLIIPFRHINTRPIIGLIVLRFLFDCCCVMLFFFSFHFAVELWSNQRDITVNWSRLKKKLSIIIVKYSFSPICNISLVKCQFIMFNYYCFFLFILMKNNSFIIVFWLSFHSLFHQKPLPIKKERKKHQIKIETEKKSNNKIKTQRNIPIRRQSSLNKYKYMI